jgi:hypothetical protein
MEYLGGGNTTGEVPSRNRRSAPTSNQRDNQENNRNDEKHMGDPNGLARDSAESKKFSDDRNDEEN